MLGTDFIDTLNKLRVVEYTGVEDFADKLSFLYSVLVLMLGTTIIAVKQYLLSAIACYVPTTPSGSDFTGFLENYCWVHGTIPVLDYEKLPQKKVDWEQLEELRINYYQWVPFMLGLQCILFYLPRVFWQIFCYNRTGSDLEHLIALANKASHATAGDREGLIKHVSKNLEDMIYQHRDYSSSKAAGTKRALGRVLGPLFASKRQGTWLVFTYFVVKLMYLANSVGQLALMQRFLGLNATYGNFGVKLSNLIISGKNWQETRIFPRISYCHVRNIRHLGATNMYTAQCVLPVNMLNEKLYIFLWFWTALVAICTIISIPVWFYRMSFKNKRIGFLRKNLKLTDNYKRENDRALNHFTNEFLRYDGIFLMRMISMNAGDVVGAEIVASLWKIYKERYAPPDDYQIPEKNIDYFKEPSAPKKSLV